MKRVLVFLVIFIIPIIVLAYKPGDTYIKGDANNDGKVTSTDYIVVRKHILKQTTLSGDAFTRSDVANDNKITSSDYIAIRKMILNGNTHQVVTVSGSQPTVTPKPSSTSSPQTQVTVTFVGGEMVHTSFDNAVVTLAGNVAVPVKESIPMSLSKNTEYVLSFDYQSKGGTNKFNVDLYPDDLPEKTFVATTTKQHYDWKISSNKSSLSDCKLRFFDNQQESGEQDITIRNVKLYQVSTKKYNKGDTFGNLPTGMSDAYEFLGWYTDSTGGTKVTNTTKVTGDMTLYARYSKIKNKPFVINSTYDYVVGSINVLDYGADPTGVKDSTNAFRLALSNASTCKNKGTAKCTNASGGVVYVPKGNYKITNQLSLSEYTALVGDLKEGTANGTVLMLYYGKGTTDYKKSAIALGRQSMVKNIAFWYPNQILNSNGTAVKYPPTILQEGVEGLTLENITFVNSYIAMDFASDHYNNALQYLKDIYGTPLHTGLINDTNLDTIKIDNLNFEAKYWLNSGFKNTPTSDLLSKTLMNSSTKPTGIIFENVDWYFLSDVAISGYFNGIKLTEAKDGPAEGEMYDTKLVNCYYPLFVEKALHTNITGSILKGKGGEAVYVSPNSNKNTDISINSSTLSSTNANTINMQNQNSSLSLTNTTVNGKILTGSGVKLYHTNSGKAATEVNYTKKVTTKAKSSKIVVIDAKTDSNITTKLNNAINQLASTGGIVFIPAGTYKITGNINVKSGVEVKGVVEWAHNNGGSAQTRLETSYYGGPLFTLNSNSGINGFSIVYPLLSNPSSVSSSQKNYAVKGNGDNIYIKNISIIGAWNGVDLKTHRCNNHYVQHVWGAVLEKGIAVGGGSTNGIVRECHFTTNALSATDKTKFAKTYQYILENKTAYEVGNSTNEILLNNFVWGNNIGYHIIDGTKNVTLIGNGCDYGNKSLRIAGSVTGQLINMLLTDKPRTSITTRGDIVVNLNINLKDNHYIEVASNHTGNLNIINSVSWGNANSSAYYFNGQTKIQFTGGILDNSASPMMYNNKNNVTMYGLINNSGAK